MTAIVQSELGAAKTGRLWKIRTIAHSEATLEHFRPIRSNSDQFRQEKCENRLLIPKNFRLLPPNTAHYRLSPPKFAQVPTRYPNPPSSRRKKALTLRVAHIPRPSRLPPSCTYLHQLAPTCRKKKCARPHLFLIRAIRVIRGLSLPSYSRLFASIRGQVIRFSRLVLPKTVVNC
jgi:hypothetical protein